jgi:hypothetical protein
MLAVWDRRSEFQVIESVQFYFNKIDIIKMPDYLPDKDDILYSRVRTSGTYMYMYVHICLYKRYNIYAPHLGGEGHEYDTFHTKEYAYMYLHSYVLLPLSPFPNPLIFEILHATYFHILTP